MAFWSTFFSSNKMEAARPPNLEALRLQVYRSDCIALRVLDKQERSNFAMRPLTHGLVEVIVEETGDRERFLRWDVLRAFGKSDAELFALARTQAASKMANSITSTDLDGGVQVIVSNNFYLSAVLLHSFERGTYKHGVLFAPVSWHHWCVHPVQAMTVQPTIAMIELVAEGVKREMRVGEYEALTGDIYWYKSGGVIEKLELIGKDADRRATSAELASAMKAAFEEGWNSRRRG